MADKFMHALLSLSLSTLNLTIVLLIGSSRPVPDATVYISALQALHDHSEQVVASVQSIVGSYHYAFTGEVWTGFGQQQQQQQLDATAFPSSSAEQPAASQPRITEMPPSDREDAGPSGKSRKGKR